MAASSSSSATETESASEHSGPTLTNSTIHTLLSVQRRQAIIDVLGHVESDGVSVDIGIETDGDGWFRFSQLVQAVEAYLGLENPGRNVYNNLYHQHIPKLAEADVVEQKKRGGTRFVRLGPNFAKTLNARNAVALVDGVSDGE